MLITKTDLSHGPQLGSQMTQLAGLFSVKEHTGHELVFLRKHLNSGRQVKLFECFDLPFEITDEDFPKGNYYIKNELMDKSVFDIDSSRNMDILGGFHTFHYWKSKEQEVKDLFKFKKEIDDEATSFIQSIKSTKPLISLHVRRGDYLQVSSLNLSLDYYLEALNRIIEYCGLFDCVVFSDDIQWCKQAFSDQFYFSENNNYVDLCSMTKCDGNIIANSSFSWWGAYLNKNQNVILCPHDYTNDERYNFLNGNYYPDNWMSIKTK